MKLGRVTGTVEASQKDASLGGQALLLCDLVNGSGDVQVQAFVAVDTCGAGVGDTVLITFNAAARMPAGAAGAATDAAIIAVVDRVTMPGASAPAQPAPIAGTDTKRSAPKKTPSKAKTSKPTSSNRRKS